MKDPSGPCVNHLAPECKKTHDLRFQHPAQQVQILRKGNINRKKKIKLQVAAVINQVLPDSTGNQEAYVLNVSGIIRPEDITSSNTISYEKIAETRISYSGRGQITDVQQPRYGGQVLDIISLF